MNPPALIAGPYKPPRIKRGVDLDGFVLAKREPHDGPHEVHGLTEAPIPWPWTICTGSRRQIIITPELERAIRTESVNAICHWWRVSRNWVERARRYLDVPRMNEGTTQLWRDLTRSRLGDSVSHAHNRGRKLTPNARAKIRARMAKGESRAELAAEYGVTRQYLSMLASGRRG